MKIAIAGAGKIGSYLVERLVAEGHDVTVIDQDEKILEEISWNLDVQTVVGKASSLDVLRKAGIASAEIVVAVTNSDETNLIVCLLADSLNLEIRKIARVRDLLVGQGSLSPRIAQVFDEFINPDREAANYLCKVLDIPGACDVIDFADGKVDVIGVTLGKKSQVVGRSLREFRVNDDESDEPSEVDITGSILVVAIAREGELIIPSGSDILQVRDTVYVASKPDQIEKIFRIEGSVRPTIKTVMIAGGNGLGRILAQSLSERDIKVKLIEEDPEVCDRLAHELENVLVLKGSLVDQTLLREEGVEDVDVFIGVTGDDEDNILSALLAKRLGAKQTAVAVNSYSYLNLVTTIGIDIVVSPMIAGASSILKFVRPGAVSGVFSTRDNKAEVFQVVVSDNSKVLGKALKDKPFPAGVIVAAVIRDDDVTIPDGETVIRADDQLILFADPGVMSKLEKLIKTRTSIL